MVNLIAHGLIIKDDKVLLIKRSRIKRGKPNFNPERWDFPGGTVERNENPRKAVVREVKEETNCTAIPRNILYDMYQFDTRKEMGFLTLIYQMDIVDCSHIRLDPEEHTEYRWISVNEILDPHLSLDILEYIVPSIKVLCDYNKEG
ncbi:MAG: hypothetical protein ACFWTJ_05460 [Lachnoclostridium sp.]|jgi:8-oxo-dGTP diphosphatase